MNQLINTDLKFEIPNNMDIALPSAVYNFLQSYGISIDVVDCFYTPLRIQDGLGSIRGINLDGRDKITTEDYINIINEVNKYFPGKVQLLIQNDIVLSDEQLQFYLDLGITKFCCGNYIQAKRIRELVPNAEICASITMNVHDYDLLLHPEYKGVFDDIILPFEYARKLDVVNSLPDDFRYRMIANAPCSIFCEGVQHGTAPLDGNNRQVPSYCPNFLYDEEELVILKNKQCYAYVAPNDLLKFKYIYCGKIVDREKPSGYIIDRLKDILIQKHNTLVLETGNINYNSYYEYIDIYNNYINTHKDIKKQYPLKSK